jgi:mRNA interferase YafQ
MKKYTVKYTSQFKKDYKLAKRRGKKMELLNKTIELLSNGEDLPENYYDHSLSGNWVGHRECHIQPDWLLVYYFEDDVLVLTVARTGSHSDLFSK